MKHVKATLLAIIIVSCCGYFRNKIEPFSFETTFQEYPISYVQFGASVGLKTKMKLIPAARDTYGAIFLN
jgi:hypothetical protein